MDKWEKWACSDKFRKDCPLKILILRRQIYIKLMIISDFSWHKSSHIILIGSSSVRLFVSIVIFKFLAPQVLECKGNNFVQLRKKSLYVIMLSKWFDLFYLKISVLFKMHYNDLKCDQT